MFLAIIDCGTTNSRVFVVDRLGNTIGKATRKVGVRDTAIHGSNAVLKQGLTETFYDAIQNAHKDLNDLSFVISSGMITSEIGLLEIPHIWAPAGLDELARDIKTVRDPNVFPIDIPIHFIRGIKNKFDPERIELRDVGTLDFMRGEEVQVAGILTQYKIRPPVTIVVLSSHTKFIPIDSQERILGSLTTVSGQVYEALIKETFIGKSIRAEDDFDDQEYFDRNIVEIADHWVQHSGFLRSLLMPRFLDTLLKTKWYERKLFVEAGIAAEDMRCLNQFAALGFPTKTAYILVGSKGRCRIYDYLLKEKMKLATEVIQISSPESIDALSIQGAVYLAGKAGLL
jgi:2-dehydro-3-deoxygalactonokinase